MTSIAKRFLDAFHFLYIFLTILLLFPPLLFAREAKVRNSLGMEFVLIPAGEFMMGSPPEEPRRNKDEVQHRVTITRPFYMQTTEVTQKQWISLKGKKMFGPRDEGALPVVKVSWYDCMDFIERLNALNEGTYRLPTEAEWEYACRGGSNTAYPWGDRISCSDAMYANNTFRGADGCVDYVKAQGWEVGAPAPAESYSPNRWKIFNLPGNVWEWCSDWYGEYPHEAVSDPTGPPSGTEKVRRGGSWFGEGRLCRSANRNFGHPAIRYKTLGFRLVREVP